MTYQWLDSNETQLTNSSQLEFSPLLASRAGTYTCRATIIDAVVKFEDDHDVSITVNRKHIYA